MTAPNDPDPTRDTEFFGKPGHWTWRRRGKKMMLSFHRGKAEACRRVHYFQTGVKA